jgi:L-alanine-DL-glutamate epimerase-like enolase superfamily enzyme
MPQIASVEPGFYRVPLPQVLTDSTHGEMRAFELNTVRVRDADGAEGVGYTFTVGRNGAAVDAVLARELVGLMTGEEAADIERLWSRAWWALHYGGRGGPTVLAISAFDAPACRSGASSAASTRRCPVTLAASTSTSPSTPSCARRTTTCPRGFAPSR